MKVDSIRQHVPAPVRRWQRRLRRSLGRSLERFRRAWARRRWLAQLDLETGFVHPSIELRGRRDFARYLTVRPECWIERDCTIWIAEEAGSNPSLRLGNVYVGRNCYLGAFQPLEIGDDTLIGAYSYIITGDHRFSDPAQLIRRQGYEGAPITIGSNVWIGCHVTILPGVTIGNNAIIGAGAVVTRPVPAGEIWAGVPATKRGSRQITE
jgi:acetyltransferase-like isoleucine patch superfamily enzyme